MSEINASKVLYVEDIGDKKKIANLLLGRYPLDTSDYPDANTALRDLIFCRSYQI
jgi:hypothetical protein